MQDLAASIEEADVLVPLMSKLDRELLLLAKRAKMILQYGVGLEAVDVSAVSGSRKLDLYHLLRNTLLKILCFF